MGQSRWAGFRRTAVLTLCVVVVGFGARATAQTASPQVPPAPSAQAPDQLPPGVPVMFRGQQVGTIYLPFGPFSAEDRARLASTRLEELVRDQAVSADEITVVHLPTTSEIRYHDRVIWVITAEDARLRGFELRQGAEQTLQFVRQTIVDTRREYSRDEILLGLGKMAAATLLLVGFVWLLIRLSNRAIAGIQRRSGAILPRLQQAQLLSADRLAFWLIRLVRVMRAVLILVALTAWTEVCLESLPWTRPYARLIVAWLEAPLSFIFNSFLDFLPNAFYLLVVSAFTYAGLRVLHGVIRQVERGWVRLPGFEPEWAEPTYKLLRVIIIALGVVAAFPYIPGSSSPAFQGISIFLGFFVTVASSSAISNMIAGVILTYTGAFRIGERVQIADTVGDVVRKSLLTTEVRTIKNVKVAIPNSLVLGGAIKNFSAMAQREGLILHTSVTIGYDAPWRQVHELLLSAALASDGIVKEPAPFVLQTALNDFHVGYELNAYTRDAHDMAAIYSRLHQNIQDAFGKAGVEIMSPAYHALRDGNRSTIGDANLGATYEAPAFRVARVDVEPTTTTPPEPR